MSYLNSLILVIFINNVYSNHDSTVEQFEGDIININANVEENVSLDNINEYIKPLNLTQMCSRNKYKPCKQMPINCLDCSIDNNPRSADCIYGEPIKTKCMPKNITQCRV